LKHCITAKNLERVSPPLQGTTPRVYFSEAVQPAYRLFKTGYLR
jgi:hypothetical protein